MPDSQELMKLRAGEALVTSVSFRIQGLGEDTDLERQCRCLAVAGGTNVTAFRLQACARRPMGLPAAAPAAPTATSWARAPRRRPAKRRALPQPLPGRPHRAPSAGPPAARAPCPAACRQAVRLLPPSRLLCRRQWHRPPASGLRCAAPLAHCLLAQISRPLRRSWRMSHPWPLRRDSLWLPQPLLWRLGMRRLPAASAHAPQRSARLCASSCRSPVRAVEWNVAAQLVHAWKNRSHSICSCSGASLWLCCGRVWYKHAAVAQRSAELSGGRALGRDLRPERRTPTAGRRGALADDTAKC